MKILKFFTFSSCYPFWQYLKWYQTKFYLGLLSLLFVDVINVIFPLVMGRAIDDIAAKQMHSVYWLGGLYAGLLIIQAFGRYLWRIFLIGTSHLVAERIRNRIYEHCQRLPLAQYQKMQVGDLMSRATNDVESVRMAVGPGVLIIFDALFMFLLLIPVMWHLSWKLSLFAFAFFPLVPFLTMFLGRKIDFHFDRLQHQLSSLSGRVQESLGAIRLIKSLVLENEVIRRFSKTSRSVRDSGIDLSKYEAVFSPSLTLITNAGTLMILFFGGVDVYTGAITLGTFVAFQRFVVQLAWPMEAIGWAVTMTQEGAAALRRIESLWSLDTVSEVRLTRPQTVQTDSMIAIKNLRFHYVTAEERGFELYIDDVSIRPGERIGVVGGVGAGKTTLFNLILRLWEPPEGTIFLEGKDVLGHRLNDLRRTIGSVEQQVFLFSEPIKSNVSLGTPIADLARIRQSVTDACIDDEIMGLPHEYETVIGERGVDLSGGQKQRLALARALVRKPKILLLDDCLSAVDAEIEENIIKNILKQSQNTTLLIASHRLSVMRFMDRILVLDGGKILDSGDHQELLKRCRYYQELWAKSTMIDLTSDEHLRPGAVT